MPTPPHAATHYPAWVSSRIIAAANPWLAEDPALVRRLFWHSPRLRSAWREIERRGAGPGWVMAAIFHAHRLAQQRHPARQEDIGRYGDIAAAAAALARLLPGTPLAWTPWHLPEGGPGASPTQEAAAARLRQRMAAAVGLPLGPEDDPLARDTAGRLVRDDTGHPVIKDGGRDAAAAARQERDRALDSAVDLARDAHPNPNPPPVNLPALLAILAQQAEHLAEDARTAPRLVPSPNRAEAPRLAFIRSLGADFRLMFGGLLLKKTLATLTAAALDLAEELPEDAVKSAFAGFTPPPPERVLSFPVPGLS